MIQLLKLVLLQRIPKSPACSRLHVMTGLIVLVKCRNGHTVQLLVIISLDNQPLLSLHPSGCTRLLAAQQSYN